MFISWCKNVYISLVPSGTREIFTFSTTWWTYMSYSLQKYEYPLFTEYHTHQPLLFKDRLSLSIVWTLYMSFRYLLILCYTSDAGGGRIWGICGIQDFALHLRWGTVWDTFTSAGTRKRKITNRTQTRHVGACMRYQVPYIIITVLISKNRYFMEPFTQFSILLNITGCFILSNRS